MQTKVKRYTELAAKSTWSNEEKKELELLAYELNIKIPSKHERAEARAAYNLIQYAVKKQLEDLPSEKRKEIVSEMKVQLQEMVTGSRRA